MSASDMAKAAANKVRLKAARKKLDELNQELRRAEAAEREVAKVARDMHRQGETVLAKTYAKQVGIWGNKIKNLKKDITKTEKTINELS